MIYYFINFILIIIIILYIYDYNSIIETKLRKNIKTNLRLDILKNLYNIIIDVSEISNTKPFIIYGTLLGYIRNRNLICYDYDIDFGIKNNEYENFKSKLLIYMKKNKDIEVVIKDFFEYKSVKLIHKETGISCDVSTLSLYNDHYIRDVSEIYTKYYLKESCYKIPKEWIDELQQVLFLDRMTYIPNNSKKLLECYYGKNYMIPDHTCYNNCNICIKK